MARGALDLIFPARCELCAVRLEDKENFVCADCKAKLPVISSPRCSICCRPLRTRGDIDRICGSCRLDSKRGVDLVLALYEYRDGARDLIHEYKYDKCQFLSLFFAEELLKQVDKFEFLTGIDWIASIPLHWTRKRWRGFNQADKIAGYISRKTSVSLFPARYFKRIKKTTPQVSLNAELRKKNIKGAFKIKKIPDLENASVVLVDDVLTTGATSNECARIFKEAGARKVNLLVLAR